MKLKTYTKELKKNFIISCLDWSNNEEVYVVSDEQQILQVSSTTRECVEVVKLPPEFIATDIHWLISRSGGGKGSDSLLVSGNDGRFIIFTKSGRIEKSITAHASSVNSARWSPDGAGILTASEDGTVKVWSRAGMLRSTVIQNEEPILCARWSPDSSSIAYCHGGNIVVKPLAANTKPTKWQAHDGLVLCLSWSVEKSIIASGGEDCKYKIWDSKGANLYSSSPEENAITAVEFSPMQNFLVIGGFNILKLCDYMGWCYNNERFNSPPVGSVYGLCWSRDGSQIACGTSNGSILFSHVVEKQLISNNLIAKTTGRKSILLQDILRETSDVLDFPERIINWSLNYGHLIVATPNQVHIFNENYINTPIIVDGRVDVKIIEAGRKYFLLVDATSIWIYSYAGRLHLNPRYASSQAQIQNLTSKIISLGTDILCVRDSIDQSLLYVFDLIPGATRNNEPYSLRSKTAIAEVSVCRSGTPEDQYIVFIDVNRDLFITPAQNGGDDLIHKIGTQLLAIKWASETNILVGLHDSCYTIWYCPGESCSDPTLIALTTVTSDATEFGRNITLESFEGTLITFKSAGTNYTITANIYCEIMHKAIMDGQWGQALKICRTAQNTILWASLAAIATKKNQLEISEEAFAAALQIDKVNYLQYIKTLQQSSTEQMAENSLMIGRLNEAETILLHNKKIKEAIALCIRMHRWERALEIAQKNNNSELQFVLSERKKYLQAMGKDEISEKFLKCCKV